MDAQITAALEKGRQLYPHPIAVACGRVLRARTSAERLDTVLRAGEALTRYVAALCLASLAARKDSDSLLPDGLAKFDKNLSWGTYLDVIQQIAKLRNVSHPLAPGLGEFRGRKKQAGQVENALAELLKIRNEIGHDLAALTEARAQVIFAAASPETRLMQALDACEPLLTLPVFVIEQQTYAKGRFRGRRLLLMGESDNPVPEEIELSAGVDEPGALYLGVREGLVKLWPWLVWMLAKERSTYAIYVIHGIAKMITYRSLHSETLELNSELQQAVIDRRAGELVAVEEVTPAVGGSFRDEWRQRLEQLEKNHARLDAPAPWESLDEETVCWYARALAGQSNEVEGIEQAREVVTERLLDDRKTLRSDEVTQLVLLFGTEQSLRQIIQREVLDCRARGSSEARWDERVSLAKNIVQCLRAAVEFFGRHVGVEGATLDGLRATSGSADYIAMREALVNIFIHQDYADPRTVAQVEIEPDRAKFFNAGKSLVSVEGLVDGGKSQARNPLIGRALRMIGFAELAGSGLRAVQETWRNERRRPPRFVSDSDANTFTLTLDWRTLPIVLDEFWKQHLGVKVTPQQSKILSLLADPSGFTEAEIASGTGLLLEDVNDDVRYLKVQALIVESKAKYFLREDLLGLLASQSQ